MNGVTTKKGLSWHIGFLRPSKDTPNVLYPLPIVQKSHLCVASYPSALQRYIIFSYYAIVR